jgi:CBS domain-containing protein
MSEQVLHLSQVLGAPLVARDGERIGRVADLIVRLEERGYPPITGLRATIAGRDVFVPAERVADLAAGRVQLSGEQVDLGRFERRPDEVLLGKDVLDRQLINVEGARLVRASEIELARVEGWWRVVGVDTGVRGFARRLLPRRAAGRVGAGPFLDWAEIEPFVGHVPNVRLRVAHPKLARLHPAQIADLVEAASHDEGAEILATVGSDEEREADVYEELDPAHQLEFIAERSDEEAAAVLARMAPDDAADLIADVDEARREALLSRLPAGHQRKVRALLGFDPATAGGLMSPDFLCLYEQGTVAEALDRVRRATTPPETMALVFTMDTHRRLEGAIGLVDLVRADPDDRLEEIAAPDPPRLRADAEFEEVARLMADFNLLVAPVVDDEGRLIGVITVDDVLEVLLPSGWRRRFGLLGGS